MQGISGAGSLIRSVSPEIINERSETSFDFAVIKSWYYRSLA